MLDIIVSLYCNHCLQFQGKLINQTRENTENLVLGSILASFSPNLVLKNFLLWVLSPQDVMHCCKLSLYAISRKTMNQTRENAKNLVSGLILAQIWTPTFFPWILPLLDVRHCCKLALYVISRKINELNLRKWQKTHMAHIRVAKFVFQNFGTVGE